MSEKNGNIAIFSLIIAFIVMFFMANHFDNCRDALLDGANVTWKTGFTACYVEVNIDGVTKQITPMQWYRFADGDK